MPQDSGAEGSPHPLSEVPLAELITRARRVADNTTLMTERAELVRELRRRGLSWRQIEQETGVPHANARRWLKRHSPE